MDTWHARWSCSPLRIYAGNRETEREKGRRRGSMALVGKPCHCLCGALKHRGGAGRGVSILPAASLSSKTVHQATNFACWTRIMVPLPAKRLQITMGAAAAAAAAAGEEEESKILWSDVVVRRRKREGEEGPRRWSTLDVATAGVVALMHGLCLAAPFTFRWGALWTAMGLYVVTGLLGITLSFHRNLAHRSFRLPKWLEYTFAYCGVQALQGSPVDWVSTHRYHHQYCDTLRDPHSPKEGFWFSHVTWLFDAAAVLQRCGGTDNVGDLNSQPFYRFLRRTYIVHPIALATLLYATGGLPYLVWGMGVRIVWVYHITWFVNSACHVWGNQSWNTGDLSRNNWWVALLAFGEGWHNNHHAFEYSARHGLEWWQVDATWYVVRLLQVFGLATHVRLPTPFHMRAMSLHTATG